MCTESDASSVASGDATLIASVASVPGRIAQMLADVDENMACHGPSPKEWCIAEVIVHLSDVEPRYRARLKRIASEDPPQVLAIWTCSMLDPLPLSGETLANFRDERVKTEAFPSALVHGAWQRPAHHATLGRPRCASRFSSDRPRRGLSEPDCPDRGVGWKTLRL